MKSKLANSFIVALFLFTAFVVVLLSGAVEIDLSSYRKDIQSQLSQKLNRNVQIQGSILLTPSVSPKLSLEKITISSPGEFLGVDLFTTERLNLQLAILPLFKAEIHVPKIELYDSRLNLLINEDGVENFNFAAVVPADPIENSRSDEELKIEGIEIESFVIENLETHYNNQLLGTSETYGINSLKGRFSTRDIVSIIVDGHVNNNPFQGDFAVGNLPKFLEEDHPPITLAGAVKFAGFNADLYGQVYNPFRWQGVDMDVSVVGENLGELGDVLQVPIPPLGPYSLKGNVKTEASRYLANNLKIEIGGSDISGDLIYNKRLSKPMISLNLQSNNIFLDDFDVLYPVEETIRESLEDTQVSLSVAKGNWNDIIGVMEILKEFDVLMDLSIENVSSSQERWGAGNIHFELIDGHFKIAPLSLILPEGNVIASLSAKPIQNEIEMVLSVSADHFDYGLIARRANIESEAEGWLSTNVDITGKASSLETLIKGADGEVAIAVWPKNIETNFIDLWAANMITTLIPLIDTTAQSTLNCLIAGFDIKDGFMEQKSLLLDTTNMTVSGNAEVDFKEQTISMALTPQAKTPQFFSLETPLSVNGSFDDFGIGVNPGNIIGTAIRFVGSIVVVPIKRIFGESLPEDGLMNCKRSMSDVGLTVN